MKTGLHNLYLLKFFHLYERTFTVLTLLKFLEKNLTLQPFHILHLKRGSFDGDHFISCKSTPGGGFGIFTDRDQRSIFWVLNFQNLYFLGLLNKSCILKCFVLSKVFLGPVLFTRCFNNHGSPLLSHDS